MFDLGQINTAYAMQSGETEVLNRNELNPFSNHGSADVQSLLVTNGDV